jgi:ribosomal protein S18 acetylase RimI-like enzyme
MAFGIHRVGPSEWRRLREIRLRALSDAPYAFGSTFEAELAWEDDRWVASVEQLAWFIATDGNEAVGLIAGLRAEGDDPRCRAVISMWVDPRCRGSGTAQALFASLADWAVQDGATGLTLDVADTNERACRFYERLGFALTGCRKPLRSDPATSSVEMHCTLRPARLRFAPSPAGDLHVGHVRTAVLTWIMAQQLHGEYFVRFENTDPAKEVPGSMETMVADLEWLGLLGDEPPCLQADMTDAHRGALERLASEGHTYHDGGAVRFRTPSEGTIEWYDFVRGRISVRNRDLDDPVLVRTSGTPTFYLASTIDDACDGITHLVRADPLRPSTAKQIHIWRSLNTQPPRVGHVPLVTGAANDPLRMGATAFTIRGLRERGISPIALLMYLAMPETASWKPPPAGLNDIIERIDLRRLPRRPITFDLQALERLHARYGRLN